MTALDLTGGLTDTATIDDPDAVTLAGPVGCRGQVVVTRAAVIVACHTWMLPESPFALPADWFEVSDDVATERWVE